MKRFGVSAVVFAVLGGSVFGASRISGTYVAHGPKFAEMLQLTQTDNGQVRGLLSSVQLKDDGTLSSDQTSETGVVDGGQLTLTVRSGILQLFGVAGTLSGTVAGKTIKFRWVDSKGNVANSVFARGTPDQFKSYVEQLKSKGAIIVANGKLLNGAEQFRETVSNAEGWISKAEMHAARLPTVKADYDRIENQMRSLIAEEQSQPYGSVPRSQISVEVGQGDIAGGQVDIEVNQIWEFDIEQPGENLYRDFSAWDGNCGNADQLQKRGLSAQAVEKWENACKRAIAERQKFIPIYKRIMDQAAHLKAFQSAAAANRKELVREANQIEHATSEVN